MELTSNNSNIHTEDTIDLLEQYYYAKARDDFYTFRRLINNKDLVGWFYKDITRHLQEFYEDYKLGRKPQLIIQAPPQFGKSSAISDFIAWVFGKDRDTRIIYASFSKNLGTRANLRLQRTITSSKFKKIFGDVTTNTDKANPRIRNKELVEQVEHNGYFRNTTCGGSITGESLDLGIIDDPVKGREQAESVTIREKTNEWYLNDFSTRFSENGAFLMILTRWHTDDLAGFIQKISPKVKVLTYQAIAEEDEEYRQAGESLFPELKSIEFLEEQRRKLGTRDFESLYQQRPILLGGNLINTEWIKTTTLRVNIDDFEKVFITADTALKTKEMNDYTVYSAFGYIESKLYLISEVRGKYSALERETIARSFYNRFSHARRFDGMYIEQKASGIDLFQRLKLGDYDKGYSPLIVKEVERNTDKVTRALDVLAYIENYNLYIYDDVDQIESIYSEIGQFPVGSHDDIVDTILDGFDIAYKRTTLNYAEVNSHWGF